MKRLLYAGLVTLCLAPLSRSTFSQEGSLMAAATLHASGTFDVKLVPLPARNEDSLGRMSIDKQFHGDLDGSSVGQMLAVQTATKGSAGYVAMERVTGTLRGKTGSFVLQHSATMNRGVPQLSVTIVPDSGTGQLTGIAGKLVIIIEGGKHSYDLEYTLPAESHPAGQ